MSWLDRILGRDASSNAGKSKVPEGVWTKCTSCDQVLYSEELKRNMQVCPKCDHHMRINARTRLLNLLDEGSAQEMVAELEPQDVLKFKDLKKYKDRLSAAQKETGEKDSFIVLAGTLHGMPVVTASFNFEFMGAQWALWWGQNLCVRQRKHWQSVFHLSVSLHQAVLVCKKRCSR